MKQGPVFYDPKGIRNRVVSSSVKVLGLITSVLSTLFILGLFAAPIIISSSRRTTHKNHGELPKIEGSLGESGISLSKYRTELSKEISKEKRLKNRQIQPSQRIIGFYAPWMDTAIESLRVNARHLTHLFPQWIRLSTNGKSILDTDYNPALNHHNQEAIQLCAKNHVKIFPILSNTDGDAFNPLPVHNMLASPNNLDRIADELRNWLTVHQFQGLNVDFENLSDQDEAKIPLFLNAVKKAFAGTPLELTCDIEVGTPNSTISQIAEPCNFVVLMLYDEHGEFENPGPIAGINWSQNSLRSVLGDIPLDKLVVGMGAYSYDWQKGGSDADTDSFEEALVAAKGYSTDTPENTVHLDPISLNSYFQYLDDDGTPHTVWMEDSISAYNQWRISHDLGVRGFALWALGQEDPTVWQILDRNRSSSLIQSQALERLHYGFSVQNVGKGDILTVKDTMQDGVRNLKIDPSSGLIIGSKYASFPSSYVIQHSGYRQHEIALTFDDGPDPEFTPQILDILHKKHVKATFFFIGKNIENNPGIVKDVYEAGNEIGSHTFFHPNLGLVSPWRVDLELNATQRTIQTITGRSTTLFRPPYNADRDPATPVEVLPIVRASQMGYLTVGESIDPRDWDPYIIDPITGTARTRTAQDIITQALLGAKEADVSNQSNRDAGNCILLHDAGGDRSKTVAALPIIIDQLRARGYKLVTVSQLLNESRSQVMPALSPKEHLVVLMDWFAFRTVFGFLDTLAVVFIFTICLGFLRIAIVFPLAILHDRKTKRTIFSPSYEPSVSVSIAAYNEERVIVQTVQSILNCKYPLTEIIVVNDGSTDETLSRLTKAFQEYPKVRIINQENSGKSTALDNSLNESTAEIIVSVDADTILEPDAVGKLVRHFENPKVGAVAGNVQVGNADNPLTIWQSIEYTTSQNIDRRGLALINAVTVVPGAIGAWRKSAIMEAGGHTVDTLAEDMDLTWRLREAGWILETESDAYAYTEVPENLKSFSRQRFRWAFGTLQCLFKHQSSVFKYGFFGWFTLPMLWIFQILFQILAPLIDLQILIALVGVGFSMTASQSTTVEVSPIAQALQGLGNAAFLYALFFLVELVSGIVAYRMEKKPLRQLWWLFLQRFVYRQIMYIVVLKAIRSAIKGARQGWGKLDRTASVRLDSK